METLLKSALFVHEEIESEAWLLPLRHPGKLNPSDLWLPPGSFPSSPQLELCAIPQISGSVSRLGNDEFQINEHHIVFSFSWPVVETEHYQNLTARVLGVFVFQRTETSKVFCKGWPKSSPGLLQSHHNVLFTSRQQKLNVWRPWT